VKVLCPKCKTKYSILDWTKIKTRVRNKMTCVKCQSQFYVQEREKIRSGNELFTDITFIYSYFEKRNGPDRRTGIDRRRKMRKDDLAYKTLSRDLIPVFNEQGFSVGYSGLGKREGNDRRSGEDRRYAI
jgi:hypothetical protein